jgi:hypothetical protein
MIRISSRLFALLIVGSLLTLSAGNASAATHYYVVANNNVFPANTVSVFELSGASLVNVTTVATNGQGARGSDSVQMMQSITQDGSSTCIFAADANTSDISAMKVIPTSPYLQVVRNFFSPDGDNGMAGMGIIVNNGYLFVSYAGTGGGATPPGKYAPPSIGMWKIDSGCSLSFVTHLTDAAGINGGAITGMAVTPNGKDLIVAYGDQSVGSYAISGGTIALIGQELTGSDAASVAISSNGQWVIFGVFSGTAKTELDVAQINNDGSLSATTAYGGDGSLGNGLDSSGIQLSPNNQFIYVVNNYSGQETTVSFDATTGVVTYPNNCLTSLRGYNAEWSYASQVAGVANAGTGAGVYISEESLNFISFIGLLQINSATGCATELPNSPFPDSAGANLQSITAYWH